MPGQKPTPKAVPKVAPKAVPKVAPKAIQVDTIVDFKKPQVEMRLQCGNCHTLITNVGSKFCYNCGVPLAWDHIYIIKPETPISTGEAVKKSTEPENKVDPAFEKDIMN